MKKVKLILYNIKRFIKLVAVFIVRIIFAKRNFKVPFFKGLYFNIFGGFTSDQVALYDLNKTNKKEYISEFEWYKSRKINYPYQYILNDKLLCVDLIKDYVNVPVTYIKKTNGKLMKDNGDLLNTSELITLLKDKKSVYFKPISFGKGAGVFRIDYINNEFLLDFKKTSLEELTKILNERDNYFISSCIKQASYLNNIYDKTSNTIRFITVRDIDNKVKLLYAVQRIGTSETIPVDNGSKGGLVAKIDLDTGVLSTAKSIHNKNEYKNHPDSNNPIEGVVIPNWDKIKNRMIEVTDKLDKFKFIAWDILVTDKDFYVLEANSSSGVNIIQIFGGQRNNVLGDFYRLHKIIK